MSSGRNAERGEERGLHFHAAREVFETSVERQVELPLQIEAERRPSWDSRARKVIEQLAHAHFLGQLLVFRDVADF